MPFRRSSKQNDHNKEKAIHSSIVESPQHPQCQFSLKCSIRVSDKGNERINKKTRNGETSFLGTGNYNPIDLPIFQKRRDSKSHSHPFKIKIEWISITITPQTVQTPLRIKRTTPSKKPLPLQQIQPTPLPQRINLSPWHILTTSSWSQQKYA